MQDKAPTDYVTAYMDGYGVKHIAPYSLYNQMLSGKKKDSSMVKRIDNQEAKTVEHSIKRK